MKKEMMISKMFSKYSSPHGSHQQVQIHLHHLKTSKRTSRVTRAIMLYQKIIS